MSLHRRGERGLTLVEMMVSIALGLLILVAIMQIFIVSKQNYRLQQNISRMQENARIAVEILQRNIREAGFEPPPAASVRLTCSSANNCLISGTDVPEDEDGSDTFITRFRSDGNMSNCQGELVANDLITGNDSFRVDGSPPSLRCGQPLVEDIEGMQILYAHRSNAANVGILYVPARGIASAQQFASVIAVRIQLCVRSPEANLLPASQTQTCLMDTDGDGSNDDERPINANSRTDGRLRQVVTTTVKLRNRQ